MGKKTAKKRTSFFKSVASVVCAATLVAGICPAAAFATIDAASAEIAESAQLQDDTIDLSKLIKDCGDQYYTGSSVEPFNNSIKVKVNGETTRIKQGKDYTVTYSNNIEMGTATAIITGIGKYCGTVEKTFNIVEYVFTVAVGEGSVASLPYSQLQKWAAEAGDNVEAVSYQFGTTAVSVPAKSYITFSTLLEKMGISDWENVTAAASDGFSSVVTTTVNKNGNYYPAQTADGYATAGSKSVPAILAFNYGTADISTTAAEAVSVAAKTSSDCFPRLFVGAIESDYVDGKIAGNRFVTDVCSLTVEKGTLKSDSITGIKAGSWYESVAKEAVNLGLIEGIDGSFAPGGTLTRAQAAVILWRYYEPAAASAYDKAAAKNETGMKDVEDGKWYTGAANWAVKNGIINGEDINGTRQFDPNGVITREQLCAIVANAAVGTVEGVDQTKMNAMPDASSVHNWAKDSVAWSLNNGVINGKGSDDARTIAPLEDVSRAEMAAIMINAIEKGIFLQNVPV